MRKRMSTHSAAALVVIWAVAILHLPSASARSHKAGYDWDDEERYHEEFHHTYPLASKGELSLENVNGGVKISTWDRNEVQVDAVKYARTEDRLANIEIEVESRSDELRLKTRFHSHFNNNPGGVRYTLVVPRAVRIDKIDLVNGGLDVEGVRGDVKASLVNGTVKAQGLAGEVEISTVNGRQEVSLEGPEVSRPVRLDSVNGRIELSLPPDVNAQVEASTLNGGIDSEFGIQVHRVAMIGHELEGTLGNGGTEIKLHNVNGSITLKRTERVAN
jgi:hypothetical protein